MRQETIYNARRSRRAAMGLGLLALKAGIVSVACVRSGRIAQPALTIEVTKPLPESDAKTLEIGISILKEAGFAVPNSVGMPQDYQPQTNSLPKELLGFYLRIKNPKVFEDYEGATGRIINAQPQPLRQLDLISTKDYRPQKPAEEEFADTLYEYIFNGVNFRKRINYARELGLKSEANVLEAKYFFWQNRLPAEYSINGQIKPSYVYQANTVVRISDYEQEKTGIFLRPAPALEINPNWPYIKDGALVVTLEGPFLTMDHEKKQATRFWKVAVGQFTTETSFSYNPDMSGFVSEQWFGPTINKKP